MATQKSHKRFFRWAPALLASFDGDGHILDASNALLALGDYERSDVKGRLFGDFIDAESEQRWREEFRPMICRRGEVKGFPIRFRNRTGGYTGTLMHGLAHRDEQGQIREVVCTFHESADFDKFVIYRRRYRRTPAMLFTLDSELRIEAVSDHWLRVLGYKREDVIGRSINDFLDPETAIGVLGNGEQLEFDEVYDHPRVILAKNGDRIEVLSSAWIEKDDFGSPLRAHGAFKNVTLRNQIEREKDQAFEEIHRLKEALEAECNYLREEVRFVEKFDEIIGNSPAMNQVMARIEAVANTPATVLITGESGVGKELVARAIHSHSDRADQPLVKVNCASIPHDLFESEFFGHVKGAFTGAHRDRIGRFQLADGGII
ncbi:MAG: sigma 54-interacting transcriptional regulator, partial [Pseudomonadota bacterium]